jgi:hypothetical protein
MNISRKGIADRVPVSDSGLKRDEVLANLDQKPWLTGTSKLTRHASCFAYSVNKNVPRRCQIVVAVEVSYSEYGGQRTDWHIHPAMVYTPLHI